MHAGALLLALRALGIVVEPDGNALRWHGPKDAMTTPLAAALKQHKALLLAVLRTFDDRARDADWDLIRAWLIDDTAKTFSRPMLAAAKRVFPVGADEWPDAYARRFRTALRVRGLLAVLGETPVPLGGHPYPVTNAAGAGEPERTDAA